MLTKQKYLVMVWKNRKNGNYLVQITYTLKNSVLYCIVSSHTAKLFLKCSNSLRTTGGKSVWEGWEYPGWQVDKYM